MTSFAAIVLAAGQGTRMRSDLPKVLHRLRGKPLVNWVIEAARGAGAERVVAVVGYRRAEVEAVLPAGVERVVQEPQLGTGHAVRCAQSLLESYPGPVAILSGDVPGLRAATLIELLAARERDSAAAAVLTAKVSGPHAYGRMVRGERGEALRIVEHKDATEEERRISEINTGTYVFGPGALFPVLAGLRTANAQREYYLTDAIGELVRSGKRVTAVVAASAEECLGVNTPEELAALERAGKA